MQNHKVVLVLVSLEKKAITKLGKFLQAGYPVFSEKSVALGKYILRCYPDFEEDCMSEENLLASIEISPNKPNARHELTRNLSNLLAVIEQFVAMEALAENQHMKGSLVADFYYQSQNARGLSKTIKQNSKLLEKVQKKESAIHLYAYLNHKLAHNFEKQKKKLEDARLHIEKAAVNLNAYFMIQQFQAGIGFIQATYSPPPLTEFPLLSASIAYVEQKNVEIPPLLKLWKLAYELTLEPQKNSIYDLLKKKLLEHFEDIQAVDAYSFVTILSNALRSQIQLGRKRYLEEQFNLYQIEIREGWLIAQGIMGYNTFNNIVFTSLSLGKKEYAQSFIEGHIDYVLPEFRDRVLMYNQARIAFVGKQFSEVLKLSQMISYFDDSVRLGIKRLQCMCYFELEDIDGLHNAVNAYKMAIYRIQELSPQVKIGNKQFLKIISFLLKYANHSESQEALTEIRTSIQKMSSLPELEWVEQILSRLSKD